MIDFKQKRSMGRYGCEGLEEWNALNGYAAKIREDLETSKTNFFWLGVHLIDLYSSNLYRLTFDREKLGVSGIVDNCSAECFFAYCYDEFGLDKTQVSRYMNIVDEFGDGLRGFKKEWEPYSYSQLCELLPLSSEQRKPIQPDWTIKRIREYKKSLVAMSQQSDEETPEAEEPPQEEKYIRFEKWTKRELCDKIIDLEAEREMLLREIENLRNPAAEEEPFDEDIIGLPPILRTIAG